MGIDWTHPIVGPAISALAGFLGVLVGTAIIPWVRNIFARRRVARYLAIRVVCILDKYVDDCATVCGDFGEEDEEGYSRAVHKAPPPPTFPTDVDWRSINYALMYEILSLPVVAEKAANYVSGAGEHADAPDYEQFFEARCEEYGTLALTAQGLATKLRKAYKVPELPKSHWDPVEYAQDQLQKLKAKQGRRAALYARHAAKIDPFSAPPTIPPSQPLDQPD